MDRDTKYSATFRAALARERVESIRLPPRSPNLNAFAERFVRSVKEECVGRMVFFGRSSLERALSDYIMSATIKDEETSQIFDRIKLPAIDPPGQQCQKEV